MLRSFTRRLAGAALLAGSLAGCSTVPDPVPRPDEAALSLAVPHECRDNVHVYLVNGCDPAGCGDLSGLRDRLCEAGFRKVHVGELYSYFDLACSLKEVHRHEPDARAVLVGYSLGANAVRRLAASATAAGVPVPLVVYLDPVCLPGNALTPEGVDRVVNVYRAAGVAQAPTLAGADNVELPPMSHFAVPTHPAAVGTLLAELSAVASVVPFTAVAPAATWRPEEGEPTPRPLASPRPLPPAGWEFLAPAGTLGEPAGVTSPSVPG